MILLIVKNYCVITKKSNKCISALYNNKNVYGVINVKNQIFFILEK